MATSGSKQPSIVEAYLAALDAQERTRALLSHLAYPRTRSLGEGKPVATAHYVCDGAEQCSFNAAKEVVRNHPDLRAYGGTATALTLIGTIESNQAEFIPHAWDGFHLHRGGHDLLRLERAGATKEGRTGYLEYNDIRAEAMDRAAATRRAALEGVLVTALDKATSKPSCAVM